MDPALIKCNDESMMQAKVPIVAAGHYSPLVKYSSPGVEWVASEGEYMTRTWDPLLMTPPSQRMVISRGVGEKPSIPVQKQGKVPAPSTLPRLKTLNPKFLDPDQLQNQDPKPQTPNPKP
jgi:hypothetical protein